MKKIHLLFGCLFLATVSLSQNISGRLAKAFGEFESDSQLKHAIASLYVIDAETGEVVFDRNSQIGLAPASTQKIITSASAFELLGKEYQYKTEVTYEGSIEKGKVIGNVITKGSGDPTFGSWRWEHTKREKIIKDVVQAFGKHGIREVVGGWLTPGGRFETQEIPDGWIWQDVGNYYGAGATGFNWHENQYDLFLHSGNEIGDPVTVAGTYPELQLMGFRSEVRSAAKGTGDNAWIYFPLGDKDAIVRGTIPVNEEKFKISGAMLFPGMEFSGSIVKALQSSGIKISDQNAPVDFDSKPSGTTIYTNFSPSLDSIVYWFNKKSINLYGEALVKTIAYEKQGYGATDSGIALIQKFWSDKGVGSDELNMRDGSGLSPLNRVTTHAQVTVLKYARTRDWFPAFYNSLPEYNGMKIKSGTISDVKGFCGYHKSKSGKEYIFSFLVNNYNGRASGLVGKMYKVLDVLK